MSIVNNLTKPPFNGHTFAVLPLMGYKNRSGAERDHMAGEDELQLAREKNEADIKDEFVSNCTFSFKLSHCHIV